MLLDLKRLLHQHGITLRGVIHVGAHYGQELSLYKSLGAKELALFEPLSDHFNTLMNSVKALQGEGGSLRIQAYQLALGSRHEAREMTIASNQGQSSSLLKPKQHLEQYPQISFERLEEVFVTRMDRIITQPHHYNLISIDVQGFELEVLKGAGEHILRHIEAVCCEVNRAEVYEENAMVEEIDRYLNDFGFERVSTVWAGGTWGDALYCRNNRRRSSRDNHTTKAKISLTQEHPNPISLDPKIESGSCLIPGIQMRDDWQLITSAKASSLHQHPGPTTLRVIRMGRFSNHLIQLINAVLVARQLKASTIVLPSDFAGFNLLKATIGDLSVVQEECDPGNHPRELRSYFWFPAGSLSRLFKRVTLQQAVFAAERIVKPLFYQHFPLHIDSFNSSQEAASRIVVHIRSGDLFRGQPANRQATNPHPYYVQPPFSFYRAALQHALERAKAAISIRLIIEDRKNPVIDALEKWLSQQSIHFEVTTGPFPEAVGLMLSATTLISSYGSVVEMIGVLSDHVDTIYSFQGFGRWAERGFGGHGSYEHLGKKKEIYVMPATSPYISPGSWQDLPMQRQLMLDYPGSADSFFQLQLNDSSAHSKTPFFSTSSDIQSGISPHISKRPQ